MKMSKHFNQSTLDFHKVLAIVIAFIAIIPVSAQEIRPDSADSVFKEDSLIREEKKADTNFVYQYIAHPFLRLLSWPIEKFAVPVFKTAFIPVKPPLKYVQEEEVLDKMIDLISMGENDQIILYPVMVIATGTGSMTGFTLRHHSIFGRSTERFVFQYRFFVNGNQKLGARLYFNKLGDTKFRLKFACMHKRIKDQTIYQPQSTFLGNYSDTSTGATVQLSHPLIEKVAAVARFHYRFHDYGTSPLGYEGVHCNDGYFFDGASCKTKRGINQKFHDFIWIGGLVRNTVNNENIPLSGSDTKLYYVFHQVTRKHNYYEWDLRWTKYFFLGVEQYTISPREQRELGPLTFEKIRNQLKYKNLKRRLFKRKVIGTHVRIGESYEIEGNTAPVYALKALGNNTPMRAYASSPFRDYAMAAWSVEYRFPVMRLVEGTFFNEYGITGTDLVDFKSKYILALDMDYLRNSWGFGIRIAREDIFLFRLQAGFHGGKIFEPYINITVDQVYF
jgi:hypothetical protein